jgi:hypothetical protein
VSLFIHPILHNIPAVLGEKHNFSPDFSTGITIAGVEHDDTADAPTLVINTTF